MVVLPSAVPLLEAMLTSVDSPSQHFHCPRAETLSQDTLAASAVVPPSTKVVTASSTVPLPVSLSLSHIFDILYLKPFPSLLDAGGNGGLTASGLAVGGNGIGGGGSALSGSTGDAYGGDAGNQAAVIFNGPFASKYLYVTQAALHY